MLSRTHRLFIQAQQTQKIRACIVAWRKVLPTEKCLVTSFWLTFQISRHQGELEKTETTKNFC